ncbi:MAG: MBL fold metallo-hydrolase [Eubacteriales bacterium]|nr:MBL fold metallo-hydrolase [Eubacteriales bacterium]
MLRIKALMENTQARPDALAEHGLSLYIETEKHKLLFDMGQSEKFAQNAQMMSVSLNDVDIAVLSHGHYDHGGGLSCFMELNRSAKVYLSRYAFEPHYSGTERFIGLDPSFSDSPRLVPVTDHIQLDDELELFSGSQLPCAYPIDSAGLTIQCGPDFVPEDFRHELYLMIHDGSRRVLISGCSHKGILNIMNWLHPDVLIGGFHFMKLNVNGVGRETLSQAAEILNTYSSEFYTCHCTGTEQYWYLKDRMGNKLHYLASGQELVLY